MILTIALTLLTTLLPVHATISIYYGTNYVLYYDDQTGHTLTTGYDICHNIFGTTLAFVESLTESDEMYTLRQHIYSTDGCDGTNWWNKVCMIGLTRDDTDSGWYWYDPDTSHTSAVYNFTAWKSGEPSGDGNCVVQACDGSSSVWNDAPCSSGYKCLFCEKNQTTTAIPTHFPSDRPTVMPTDIPTDRPTDVPTNRPSWQPSELPTDIPSAAPSRRPTSVPTSIPSGVPTTLEPTEMPSVGTTTDTIESTEGIGTNKNDNENENNTGEELGSTSGSNGNNTGFLPLGSFFFCFRFLQ